MCGLTRRSALDMVLNEVWFRCERSRLEWTDLDNIPHEAWNGALDGEDEQPRKYQRGTDVQKARARAHRAGNVLRLKGSSCLGVMCSPSVDLEVHET